jgi:hypothetical protein
MSTTTTTTEARSTRPLAADSTRFWYLGGVELTAEVAIALLNAGHMGSVECLAPGRVEPWRYLRPIYTA